MSFNTFALCMIIGIAIIFYFDDNREHLETLGPGNRLIVGDTSGNLESIDYNKVVAPKGLIAMWSGNSVPSGWVLCDGNRGNPVNGLSIPDLRGRFVVMINPDTNKSSQKDNPRGTLLNVYKMDDSGGEQQHILTTREMLHAHEIPTSRFCRDGNKYCNQVATGTKDVPLISTTERLTDRSPTAHNNIPPYYALAYIIKTV